MQQRKCTASLTVTQKVYVHWKGAVFTILDGIFSGYYEAYFGKDIPRKYMQRLDEFSVHFRE